jgi:uncharacterized YigZ family protein
MTSEIVDKYYTIANQSEGIYKEKGSKFLAFAYPVNSEEEIKEIQKELRKKYFDARHHVYAFRLGAEGQSYRSSDDGEPSNSSGPPVLGQLLSFNITNVLVVVIRYFGGTKLGIPGLINAYRSATADAIENNTIIEQFEQDAFTIHFGYTVMNDVMRILKEENPEQSKQQFDNACSIHLAIRKKDAEHLRTRLNEVEGLHIEE